MGVIFGMLLSDTVRSNWLKLFESRNDYGYHFSVFSDKQENIEIKGRLEKLKSFVLENEIDEIYCSMKEVSNAQLNKIMLFLTNIKKQLNLFQIRKRFFKELTNWLLWLFPVLS
jgi:putative colanic acid biosynthesis UDP-glucose lipid carrier transferase